MQLVSEWLWCFHNMNDMNRLVVLGVQWALCKIKNKICSQENTEYVKIYEMCDYLQTQHTA